jgi:Rad3-related DNA helicase
VGIDPAGSAAAGLRELAAVLVVSVRSSLGEGLDLPLDGCRVQVRLGGDHRGLDADMTV